MKTARAIPEDFAEVAWKLKRSTGRLQAHYGAGQRTVYRWLAEAGIPTLGKPRPPKREVPDDFAEVCPTMCQSALARHYKARDAMVKRWCRVTGLEPAKAPPSGKQARPAPADFTRVAPTMSINALSRHYKINVRGIKRWIEETGVVAKPYVASPPKPRIRNKVPKANAMAHMGRPKARELAPTRVKSIYDEAADTLRRERFLVNRCNERGGYDPEGKFWRVGWSTVTPDELLVRAARYERKAA